MSSHSLFSSATTCSHHHSFNKPDPFSSISQIPTQNLQSQWLGVTKFPLKHSHTRPRLPKTRPVSANVTFSLPTANPEGINSTDKVPKWSLKGIKSFAMGELEARKLKFSTTGTEAILMGILVEDEVFLKSILNSTETVARERVQSLDPNDLVGGTEIGPEWCEVKVQVPIKKDENWVRPYGLFSTVQDCIGASIAWPYPFISVVHED